MNYEEMKKATLDALYFRKRVANPPIFRYDKPKDTFHVYLNGNVFEGDDITKTMFEGDVADKAYANDCQYEIHYDKDSYEVRNAEKMAALKKKKNQMKNDFKKQKGNKK